MGSVIAALTVLDYAITLVSVGSVAYAKLMERRTILRTIQTEGRDPTPEEWQAMFGSIEIHKRRIRQSAPK